MTSYHSRSETSSTVADKDLRFDRRPVFPDIDYLALSTNLSNIGAKFGIAYPKLASRMKVCISHILNLCYACSLARASLLRRCMQAIHFLP